MGGLKDFVKLTLNLSLGVSPVTSHVSGSLTLAILGNGAVLLSVHVSTSFCEGSETLW